MAKEVAHVVQLRLSLQEPAREFAPEVVEAQSADAGAQTRREPGLIGFDNLLAHGVAEHVGVRAKLFSIGIVTPHGQHGAQSRTDRHDAHLLRFRVRSFQYELARVAFGIEPHVLPLQRQQFAAATAG